MIDILALHSTRARLATNILTIPALRAIEEVASECRKLEATVLIILGALLPFAEHRIPGAWNVRRIPSVLEIDGSVVDIVLPTRY